MRDHAAQPRERFLPSALFRGVKPFGPERRDIYCGTCKRLTVAAGDILTLVNESGGTPVWLFGLDPDGARETALLFGLDASPTVPLDLRRFDARHMREALSARDRDVEGCQAVTVFDEATAPGERFIFKASCDANLFVIVPVANAQIEAGGGGHAVLEIQRAPGTPKDIALPDPLGKVRDEFRVDRATARAYEVRKGEFIQIIDVEGQQCSDFMAMRSDALDRGLERFIDGTVTRSLTHGAYPRPGMLDKFYDQDMTPLLSVEQDTVGRHDTFALACTARGYEDRGFPGHINCSDNISAAYAPFGIAERRAWPAVNFFFNSWILPGDNLLSSDEAWSRPGDYVAMRALTDLVCVSTACPDDVDPINGWNPSDVHVRIYSEDTRVSKSVVYRETPESEGRLTEDSAFAPRTADLTRSFEVGRSLWMPSRFDATGAVEEYWTCKTAATVQDVSPLRKFDVMGPDAARLLQHCMTRNVAKVAVHRGVYALLCDERGTVLDDGTLFRIADDVYRWCCGSDRSGVHLQEQAEALGLRVWIKPLSETMPNLAVQGPRSREIVKHIVFTQPARPSVDSLKWFGCTIGRLHDRDGPPFMVTRTGFTGELGYEFFCDRSDAPALWDAIIEAGEPFGLTPMGGAAMEMLRIEAGLMTAGAEIVPEVDAFEAGLGFAVDFKKDDFIGRAALERNAAAPRRKLVGLLFDGDEHPGHGDGVFLGRDRVGTVTSATRSPQLGHAIAMARVAVENAEAGNRLEVGRLDGEMKRLPCRVSAIPFIDPIREKPRR